jgi:hypothetical protein
MRVTRISTVTIDPSANDWELYDNPGRDDAATALNEHFMRLVNKGCARDEVERGMLPKLREYGELGAFDSEGLRFLDLLLDTTFGTS